MLLGRPGEPNLLRLRGLLTRNGDPNTLLDAESDAEGRAIVGRLGVLAHGLPLMVCPNRTVLKRPTDIEAAVCLGMTPDLTPTGFATPQLPGPGLRAWRPPSMGLGGPLGAGARPARHRRAGGRLGADPPESWG